VVTIRTQPVVDSIFMEQLNSYHTTIKIGRRIAVPEFFGDAFINPVSTTLGTVLKCYYINVVHNQVPR
jgi:hypothetical protein